MAPLGFGAMETLDRIFNAYWREGFASSRRISRVHGASRPVAVLRLPGGEECLAGVRGICALDRLRTEPPYALRRPSGDVEFITTPGQLLDVLQPDSGALRLMEEATQSAQNMEFFLTHARARARALLSAAGTTRGLLGYAHERSWVGAIPAEAWLESWVLRGHALHPGAKTRMGFGSQDLLRYSPELECRVDLRFVALRRTHFVEVGSECDCAADWSKVLEGELRRKDLTSEEYGLLPVHPWQFDHTLPKLFRSEIDHGALVPLDGTFPVQPLASLRTMVPIAAPGACHFKLPIAIQATSLLRTITAPTIENGPAVSAWFEAALVRDPGLARVLSVQAEPLGAHYWDPGRPLEDTAALEKARHLCVIVREPPKPVSGTWLVPCVLLPELSPLDERPVACELVDRCGGDPVAFLRDYALLFARALLPLAAHHGVSLECHSQNSTIRCSDGRPVELIARDLGGLKFYRPWMEGEGRELRLRPGSQIEARSPEDLVSNLHHSWVQGNLAPLASALAEAYDIDEPVLWRAMREAVRQAWEELLAATPGLRTRELGRLLFSPRIQVKALTRMRLSGDGWREEFCEVPNPLAEAAA